MGYTATATAKGGRNGHVETADGTVKFDLSLPKELGGASKEKTANPEQLFAAAYAACFGGALDVAARQAKVEAKDAAVTTEVTIDKNDSGFFLAGKIRVSMPGVDRATAEKLVQEAHQICPYSKATRGNIKVELEVQ